MGPVKCRPWDGRSPNQPEKNQEHAQPPQAITTPRRVSSTPTALCCIAALLLALWACAGSTPRQVTINPRPVAFRPWDFPDVPMPPGYSAADDAEQLAVVIAGGNIRRMSVVLQQVRRDRGLRDHALLNWYDQRLAALGWYPLESSERRVRRWGKRRADQREERLRLATGRSANSAIIRIQLTLSPDDVARAD